MTTYHSYSSAQLSIHNSFGHMSTCPIMVMFMMYCVFDCMSTGGRISDRPDPFEAFAHMHAKHSYHVVELIQAM